MGNGSYGPTSNEEIEKLLRDLKRPNWMNWVALLVSVLALIVAVLAWQRPIVVNNNIKQPPPPAHFGW